MNTLARDIRTNRAQVENIINEFRAYWCKLYRAEANSAYERAKNDGDKAERYAIEQLYARVKSMAIKPEIEAIVRDMHDNDRLVFGDLRLDYIRTALHGLDYVNEACELCELRKKDKEATEKTWEPVVKWTEAKVGRYFRLANIRVNEAK